MKKIIKSTIAMVLILTIILVPLSTTHATFGLIDVADLKATTNIFTYAEFHDTLLEAISTKSPKRHLAMTTEDDMNSFAHKFEYTHPTQWDYTGFYYTFTYKDTLYFDQWDWFNFAQIPQLYAEWDDSRGKFVTKQSYAEEIASVVKSVAEKSSDTEKVRVIYDYLIQNTEYAYEADKVTPDMNYWSSYDAITNNLAICQGYALSFATICLEAGIPCRILTTETHAWNQVQVDGKWMNIDATNGDNPGQYDMFFLKWDNEFVAIGGSIFENYEYFDPCEECYGHLTGHQKR